MYKVSEFEKLVGNVVISRRCLGISGPKYFFNVIRGGLYIWRCWSIGEEGDARIECVVIDSGWCKEGGRLVRVMGIKNFNLSSRRSCAASCGVDPILLLTDFRGMGIWGLCLVCIMIL